MDLHRGERVLSQLEKEAANVAAVGALRQDLEALQSTLNDAAGSLETLRGQLDQTNTSLKETSDSIRQTLRGLENEFDKIAKDIDERVRTQINSATTQYGTLLRGEIQAVVDRVDLNHREEKQLLEQGLINLSATIEATTTKLEKKQRHRFKWLIAVILVSAISVAGSVMFMPN